MDEESDRLCLTQEGQLDVARWITKAYDSGHFDWRLLCGGDAEESISERWRLVAWLNEEKLLDEPLFDVADPDDREISAAMMLTFFFASGVSPAEVLG